MESFEEVFEVVKLIPYGKVTSYGAIAKYLSTSPRVVGWAMNAVDGRSDIPAHRVVNRNGVLTGKIHFQTPGLMQDLLEKEGLVIKNDQIQNFENHFWSPQNELL